MLFFTLSKVYHRSVWARGSFGESAENYQFAWSQLITSSGSTRLQIPCLLLLCQDIVDLFSAKHYFSAYKRHSFLFKMMRQMILTLNFSDQLLAPVAGYIPNQ